jgi:hypothetical protein
LWLPENSAPYDTADYFAYLIGVFRVPEICFSHTQKKNKAGTVPAFTKGSRI